MSKVLCKLLSEAVSEPFAQIEQRLSSAMGCGQSGGQATADRDSKGVKAHDKQQAKEENKQYQAWDQCLNCFKML